MAVYNRLIRAAAFHIIDLTKPFTIGLTGPTGAGKGFVGEILYRKGFHIIDSDAHARQITEKISPVFPALQAAFGKDIIKDGVLDRQLLAARAFADSEKTAQLNAIMHPAIAARCREEADGLCVLDAPLLFEAGLQKDCYKTIAVLASEDVRLERILRRDDITREQALQRMHAQHGEAYYADRSDYVIHNNGESLEAQLDAILEEIL